MRGLGSRNALLAGGVILSVIFASDPMSTGRAE